MLTLLRFRNDLDPETYAALVNSWTPIVIDGQEQGARIDICNIKPSWK